MAATLRSTVARRGLPGAEIHGPAPAYVERLRGRHRRIILVRAPDPRDLLEEMPFGEGWAVDIDPAAVSG